MVVNHFYRTVINSQLLTWLLIVVTDGVLLVNCYLDDIIEVIVNIVAWTFTRIPNGFLLSNGIFFRIVVRLLNIKRKKFLWVINSPSKVNHQKNCQKKVCLYSSCWNISNELQNHLDFVLLKETTKFNEEGKIWLYIVISILC